MARAWPERWLITTSGRTIPYQETAAFWGFVIRNDLTKRKCRGGKTGGWGGDLGGGWGLRWSDHQRNKVEGVTGRVYQNMRSFVNDQLKSNLMIAHR